MYQKITNIWCSVPEIRSEMYRIFCHTGLFFALSPPPQQPGKSKFWKNKKSTCRCRPFTRVYLIWRSNDVWFLRYKAQWTEFFVILGHFLPFYPTKNQENFFLKKWNISLEILSFYSCASQMAIIWCMVCEKWSVKGNFLSFWTIFCLFTFLSTWKIRILKKWKKHLKVSFYTSIP